MPAPSVVYITNLTLPVQFPWTDELGNTLSVSSATLSVQRPDGTVYTGAVTVSPTYGSVQLTTGIVTMPGTYTDGRLTLTLTSGAVVATDPPFQFYVAAF